MLNYINNIFSIILSSPYFAPAYKSIIAIIIGLIINYIISKSISRIKTQEFKYTFKKILRAVIGFIVFIVIITIWVKDLSILIVAIGLFSAGLAFSLRDPITSIVGWFSIIILRPFKTGDRIKVNENEGDVIDFDIFYTYIMEIGAWTNANLYTGRVIVVPNSILFTSGIINYSKDFNYLWDNITITVNYSEDLEKAQNLMIESANEITNDFMEKAKLEYNKFKSKYYIKLGTIAARTFISITDNFVKIDLRYITDYRVRKDTNQKYIY